MKPFVYARVINKPSVLIKAGKKESLAILWPLAGSNQIKIK